MLNKVILMGRLTRDPEQRATASGISVCSFSLAVQRDFARQGEERQTDFINCIAFRSTADFVARYFRKGQLVAVCGKLQQRSWQDNDGKNRSVVEVVADEVHFAEPKRDNSGYNADPYDTAYSTAQPQGGFGGGYSQPQSAPQGFMTADDENDVPF